MVRKKGGGGIGKHRTKGDKGRSETESNFEEWLCNETPTTRRDEGNDETRAHRLGQHQKEREISQELSEYKKVREIIISNLLYIMCMYIRLLKEGLKGISIPFPVPSGGLPASGEKCP